MIGVLLRKLLVRSDCSELLATLQELGANGGHLLLRSSNLTTLYAASEKRFPRVKERPHLWNVCPCHSGLVYSRAFWAHPQKSSGSYLLPQRSLIYSPKLTPQPEIHHMVVVQNRGSGRQNGTPNCGKPPYLLQIKTLEVVPVQIHSLEKMISLTLNGRAHIMRRL